MFDNPVFVVILLVIVAALGAAAGFFAGRAKGQDMARGAKESDLNEAKAQIEADKQDISNLNAAVVQYRTQAEGFSQQLTYLKSQLAQAQRAEEMRVERERQRAAEEANRRQAESERKLQEQSKVLSALAPVQKNLDALQTKVAQIEEGRKHEMGALGEQLKGLGEQQARLDRETSALSSALRNNKVRGAWGEAQLRNIVESAGLLEHVDFDTQVVVTDAEGRTQRPDMVSSHAGRQNHSDRREGAIRRLPARMRDSRHRLTGGTGPQERAAAFPCQSGTRPCEDPGRQSLLERVQRCSGFRDRVHPQRIVAAGRVGNRPDTDGRRIRAESRADLADHPMGGAQIRGIRMAAAKPDR